MDVKFLIIGGGAVGLSSALALSKRYGGEVALLERGKRIPGENQSSRSSQVIHAGCFYEAASRPYTARHIAEANAKMYEFCFRAGVPCRKTGKLLPAVDAESALFLNEAEKASLANGVAAARVSAKEALELEPSARCMEALFLPSSGIFDAPALLLAYARIAKENGATILVGNEVIGIEAAYGGFRVAYKTASGEVGELEAENVINAAGLFADRIAKMVNPETFLKILAVRKVSAVFTSAPGKGLGVRGNIYPAPVGYTIREGKYERLSYAEYLRAVARGENAGLNIGIHLTPTLGEGGSLGTDVTLGPWTGEALADDRREDYSFVPENLEFFAESVKAFFPGLRTEHLRFRESASMAYTDGKIEYSMGSDPKYPNFLNLHGMNSPALTMSYFIGEDVARRYESGLWADFLK